MHTGRLDNPTVRSITAEMAAQPEKQEIPHHFCFTAYFPLLPSRLCLFQERCLPVILLSFNQVPVLLFMKQGNAHFCQINK